MRDARGHRVRRSAGRSSRRSPSRPPSCSSPPSRSTTATTAGSRCRPTRASPAAPKALVDQAEYFSKLAKNIIVKIPATKTGVEAIEDATYRGVNINVTVSFTVAQAVASRRGHRAWPEAPRGRGPGHLDHGSGRDHHGRPPRRLAEGALRQGRPRLRPGLPGVGRRRSVQEGATRSSRSAVCAPACSSPPTATPCSGPSSSAATSCSPRRSPGRSASRPAATTPSPASTCRSTPGSSRPCYTMPEFRKAYDIDGMTPDEFDDFGADPQDAAPVPRVPTRNSTRSSVTS